MTPVSQVAAQSCVQPPDGLVSWWPGDGHAKDIQDGNDGTLQNGATFASGKVGKAFSFDGADDFVQVSNSLYNPFPATGFTYDFWINPSDTPAGRSRTIVSNHQGSVNFWNGISLNDGQVELALQNKSTDQVFQWFTTSTLTPNEWHHIAVTYKNEGDQTTDAKIYINGVPQILDTAGGEPAYDESFTPGYNPGDALGLAIGRLLEDTPSAYFKGLIDEVEFSDRALSDAEIQAIFNAGSAGKCKIDHFLCYKAKSTKGNICSSDSLSNAGGSCEVEEDCGGTEDDTDFCVANKFPKGIQASLNDQFEDKDFVVKKPVNLCAPADKNDEGINDADTHLKGYLIKEVPNSCTTGAPANAKRACAIEEDCGGTTGSTSFCQKTLKHVPETNIKVRNQFHEEGKELVVDTIKPDRLLVPTVKSLTGPVDAPDNNAHNVDHYKCYKVKVSKGQPKFVPILGVPVSDQFIDADPNPPVVSKLFDLKKPTRLCNPVQKTFDGNIEEIKNDKAHLMCYQAKPAIGEPKHTPVIGIHVNNQFGAEQLDTIKEDELCVPSEKIL